MKQQPAINAYDFHCHIDLHPDPPTVVRACERERVVVLAVTTTPRAWSKNTEWTAGSAFVHAAVGLHPELVGERYEEAGMLEDLIGQSRLIGEIGLDGSRQHRNHSEKQQDVFARSLIAANKHGGRLVSIHSRLAAADVISMIERHTKPDRVTCILHWFSGSQGQLRRAADIGCYFSVNEAMLHNNRGRAIVENIPSQRLLTETDAPFVTVKGTRTHPASMGNVLKKLADLRRAQPTELREQIDHNAKIAFSTAGILLARD